MILIIISLTEEGNSLIRSCNYKNVKCNNDAITEKLKSHKKNSVYDSCNYRRDNLQIRSKREIR